MKGTGRKKLEVSLRQTEPKRDMQYTSNYHGFEIYKRVQVKKISIYEFENSRFKTEP